MLRTVFSVHKIMYVKHVQETSSSQLQRLNALLVLKSLDAKHAVLIIYVRNVSLDTQSTSKVTPAIFVHSLVLAVFKEILLNVQLVQLLILQLLTPMDNALLVL